MFAFPFRWTKKLSRFCIFRPAAPQQGLAAPGGVHCHSAGVRRDLPEPDRQTGGRRAADRRAGHRSHRSARRILRHLFSNLSKQIKSWVCPAPSTGWSWTPPGFRSGWPVSRTRPSPPTATLGTPCTAPTAPKRRCTSTSRKSGLSAEREHGCRMEPAGQCPARRQPARLPEIRA